MIRLAKESDIPELLRMGELFFNASGYKGIAKYNKEDSTVLLKALIELGTILTDGKSAMLGFVLFPMFMDKSTIISQEMFWWVDEDKRGTRLGVEILKEAEKVSKESGATVMAMLSLNDLNGEKVNKLYSRLGYNRKEQTYMRIL